MAEPIDPNFPESVYSTELGKIQHAVHKLSVEKGWWDRPRSIPESLCLIHSEVSEALEEYRNGKATSIRIENGKPEGMAIELADIIIRVLDLAEWLKIDIATAIDVKHSYNQSRPYRHGGKAL